MEIVSKHLFTMVLGITLMTVQFSFAQKADDILGRWQDANHPAKQVEISKTAGSYVGKVINDTAKKPNNGKVVFKDLIFNPKDFSYSGLLINPDNDDSYEIKFKIEDGNAFSFKVSRFFLAPALKFKRIKS